MKNHYVDYVKLLPGEKLPKEYTSMKCQKWIGASHYPLRALELAFVWGLLWNDT